MAENKKSVIVYVDWGLTFDKLDDAEAGKLIKHFFNYVRDMNPVAPDRITELLFENIKLQLKRDLEKWEAERSERSISGHMGGIKSGEARRKKRKQNEAKQSGALKKEANEASASKTQANEASASKTQANEAVTVTVTVNDNVNEIKKEWDSFLEMRKKIKAPPTDHAKELLIKKLNDLSGNNIVLAKDILNQSTVNNWKDIYQIKKNQLNGNHQSIPEARQPKALN